MNELATAIEDIRAELATVAPEIFPDACEIVSISTTTDEFGNPLEVRTVIASNVPMKYSAMSSSEKIIGEGEQSVLSHKLKMGVTADTITITPSYQIVVEARGESPKLTFENPTSLIGSFSPFMVVAANLRQI